MARTNAAKEAAAVAVTGLGGWLSVHTSDPGTTGANEATGGTPTYARKQTTWTPGAADGVSTGSMVTIDVPPGTYTHAGQWSAAVAGTFVQGVAFPTPIVATEQGQINLTPTDTES